MGRLHVQRRLAAGGASGSLAGRDHVGRRVDTVDVEPVNDPRHEQPATPAAHVECWLSRRDVRPEERDLRSVEVEVGPPPGDQAVMPRRCRCHPTAVLVTHDQHARGSPLARSDEFDTRVAGQRHSPTATVALAV